MSISFKKSMLALTIVSALTAGFSGIAAAVPKDYGLTAPITDVASTPGPLSLVAGGHGGGGNDRGSHDHGGHDRGGRGRFWFNYGNDGVYDGVYQAWPTECNGLALRLERKHVPYWKEQAILARRGCI